MSAGFDSAVHSAAQLVRDSEEITVLTGAGISTDSGIPDFRGPNGVWTKDPGAAARATLQAYVDDPALRRESWRRRLAQSEAAAEPIRPNAAHRALLGLEQRGQLRAIVTQNVDGLHQSAGSEAGLVIEVHGNLHACRCLSCGDRTPMSEALARVAAGEEDPACLGCGGILKSATISFGQALDPQVFRAAVWAASECDLLLVIGTSLTVRPVADLARIAAEAGAAMVIVNATPTPYDSLARIVVRDPIGAAVPAIVGSNEGLAVAL